MSRVVLKREQRTVSGTFRIPGGAGTTSMASSYVNLTWTQNFEVSAFSDSGAGYGWRQGATRSVGANISFRKNDMYEGGYIGVQRAYGDAEYFDGSYSLTGEAELCLYTYGRDVSGIDSPTPDDYYPTYGGPRAVGEFPENNAKLAWEWIPNQSYTVTLTFDGETVSDTSDDVTISDAINFHVDVIDDSWFDSGGVEASITFGGIPLDQPTHWKRYYGGHDCQAGDDFAGSVEISTGGVKLINRGWLRCSVLQACSMSVNGSLWIPRLAEFEADAMAMEHPHPHNCSWTLLEKWKTIYDGGDIRKEPVYKTLTGQKVSHSIRQNKALIDTIQLYNKAVNRVEESDSWKPGCGMWPPGAPAQFYRCWAHAVDETGPVQCWITPPPGEDPKDWRVGFRGKQFDALKVTHAANLSVPLPSFTRDGGSDESPNYSGTWSDPQIFEAYRYLKIDGSCTSVKIGGKSWAVPESRVIDLVIPDNTQAKVDGTNTRYPVEYEHYDRSTVEGPLWGVTLASSIKAIGGTITGLTLQRKEHAKTHALEPLQDWHEWHRPDEVGDHTAEWYCQRALIGDVDGRQSLEPYDVLKRVDNAPNRRYSTDYLHQTISGLADQINLIPGYTATLGGALDPYHDPNTAAAWFAAQGYTRSGSTWAKGWDLPSGTMLKAQPIFDSIEWSDVCGDVFGVGLGGSTALGLVGRKVFRSSTYGTTMNGGSGKRAEPFQDPLAVMKGYNTDESGTTITTSASESHGYYWLGPTLTSPNRWGKVQMTWDTEGTEDDVESAKVTVGSVPRRIDRVAFATPKELLEGAVSYDVARHGRHVIAYTKRTDAATVAALRISANATHTEWTEHETEIECKSLCVRWTRGKDQSIAIMYVDQSDAVQLAFSKDEGETFTVPITINSSGVVPCFILGAAGTRYFYWLESDGSSHAIRGQIRNALNEIIEPTFDVKSGVDRDGLAVDESFADKGGHRITLVYVEGGELNALVSSNGKDFA